VPTYQYACTACGHQLEAVQSFTDDALTECPECAGTLRKLFGNVGVVFKGSGFYRNDSRGGSSGSSGSGSDSSSSNSKDSSSSSDKSSSASSAGSTSSAPAASTANSSSSS